MRGPRVLETPRPANPGPAAPPPPRREPAGSPWPSALPSDPFVAKPRPRSAHSHAPLSFYGEGFKSAVGFCARFSREDPTPRRLVNFTFFSPFRRSPNGTTSAPSLSPSSHPSSLSEGVSSSPSGVALRTAVSRSVYFRSERRVGGSSSRCASSLVLSGSRVPRGCPRHTSADEGGVCRAPLRGQWGTPTCGLPDPTAVGVHGVAFHRPWPC